MGTLPSPAHSRLEVPADDQLSSLKPHGRITDRLLQKTLTQTQSMKDAVLRNKDLIQVSDLKQTGRNELKSLMEIKNLQRQIHARQDPTQYDAQIETQKMRVLDLSITLREQRNKSAVDMYKAQLAKKQEQADLQEKRVLFRKKLNRLGFSEGEILSHNSSEHTNSINEKKVSQPGSFSSTVDSLKQASEGT